MAGCHCSPCSHALIGVRELPRVRGPQQLLPGRRSLFMARRLREPLGWRRRGTSSSSRVRSRQVQRLRRVSTSWTCSRAGTRENTISIRVRSSGTLRVMLYVLANIMCRWRRQHPRRLQRGSLGSFGLKYSGRQHRRPAGGHAPGRRSPCRQRMVELLRVTRGAQVAGVQLGPGSDSITDAMPYWWRQLAARLLQRRVHR